MHPENRDPGKGPRRAPSAKLEGRRLPRSSAIATHRALFHDNSERRCDICEAAIAGEGGGSGLYVWTRGTEVRYEEPPLCDRCGAGVTVVAMRRWEEEDEEEG